jgi:hypothetical protein
MSGVSVASRPPTGTRFSPEEVIRRASLGTAVALLIQYGLGMWVNLYATIPAGDQGGGDFAAIGRALAHGPAGLAVHTGLGLLLLAGSIVPVARAVAARRPAFIVTGVLSLLAVLGAAASGAAFVNAGANGASLSMALLTAVALLCQVVNLFLRAGVPNLRSRRAHPTGQSSGRPRPGCGRSRSTAAPRLAS